VGVTKAVSKHDLIAEIDTLIMPLMSLMQQDFLESIKPFSLNPGGAILLEHVAKGVKHPKELAGLLDTVPPVISALLGELEDKGLIERQIDPEDKRRVKLTLSKQGKDLHEKIRERSLALGGERLSKLSDGELTSLIRIFRKLLEEAQRT
jgi:MarR family transcriptional regulator, multiple antibiotic resistance protein MarR